MTLLHSTHVSKTHLCLSICISVLVCPLLKLCSMAVQYEPTIEELRHKYEVAMKEKMLVRLEKERLQARTEALEAQVPSLA